VHRRALRRARRPAGRASPAAVLLLVGLLVVGCSQPAAPPTPPQDPRRPVITVTSFDFPESETLSEIYVQALRRQGYPVQFVPRLGSREIVQPALEQGRVDLVPGYLGSGLNFLSEKRVATADPRADHARLQRLVAARGLTALAFAPAQNRNGFVITGDMSRTGRIRRLSDLRPIADQLVLGGPPECPDRPLCLVGLREVYGLEFKHFEPMASRQVTADALEAGEIDVGMLETTDGNLAGRDLIQLADDRHLQPAENIVPIVRNQLIAVYGQPLVRLVDAVTAQITTADLIQMNQRVEVDGAKSATVAADWLRSHPLGL
jgi:osmoprotectant transport system substrate-binding protein